MIRSSHRWRGELDLAGFNITSATSKPIIITCPYTKWIRQVDVTQNSLHSNFLTNYLNESWLYFRDPLTNSMEQSPS